MSRSSAAVDWRERVRADHKASIARGEHDSECEFDVDAGYYLCHCSKRRREAAGVTEVPTDDLYFPPPDCPRCGKGLDHDGDQWRCYPCCLSWDSNGSGDSARFTDVFSDDLAADKRRWDEKRERPA